MTDRAKGRRELETPPRVSRWYRFDWQFAIDMSNLPFLRFASLMIGAMPLIIPLFSGLELQTEIAGHRISLPRIEVPQSAWLLWGASVAFIASWTVLRLACPRLLQEYRDFGEYRKREHSHRWIAWLFYNNFRHFPSQRKILQETHDKGILFHASDIRDSGEYAACPYLVEHGTRRLRGYVQHWHLSLLGRRIFLGLRTRPSEPDPPIDQKRTFGLCGWQFVWEWASDNAADAQRLFRQIDAKEDIHIFHPVNINRDIYIPIHFEGSCRILTLQESDTKLATKEKELFWIFFSQAAKESPIARSLFWVLFYTMTILLVFNIGRNVYRVTFGG